MDFLLILFGVFCVFLMLLLITYFSTRSQSFEEAIEHQKAAKTNLFENGYQTQDERKMSLADDQDVSLTKTTTKRRKAAKKEVLPSHGSNNSKMLNMRIKQATSGEGVSQCDRILPESSVALNAEVSQHGMQCMHKGGQQVSMESHAASSKGCHEKCNLGFSNSHSVLADKTQSFRREQFKNTDGTASVECSVVQSADLSKRKRSKVCGQKEKPLTENNNIDMFVKTHNPQHMEDCDKPGCLQPFHSSTLTSGCYEQCVLFIDDSNLFIEGQKHFAKLQNLLVPQDRRCRIDIGKLLDLALHGRELYYGKLYGSEPPALDTVWRKIREHLDVETYHKNEKGKEKEVDTALTAAVVEYVLTNMDKIDYQTVIIVAGDRDYYPTIETILKHEWKVEILAFSKSLSKAMQKNLGSRCGIFALEDLITSNVNSCCFVESRWKIERHPVLPRDRTKVLRFRKPFNLRCQQQIIQIKRLVDEITAITRVPCYYHCGSNRALLFIIGNWHPRIPSSSARDISSKREKLAKELGNDMADAAIALLYPKESSEAPDKIESGGLDFFRIWRKHHTVIERKCCEICNVQEFIDCIDIIPFLQKPEAKFLIEMENRFEPLASECDGDEFSDDEYGCGYLEYYNDHFPSMLSDNDLEDAAVDENGYAVVTRPLKFNSPSFSEKCLYEFSCQKGTKCSYKHTKEEKAFFKAHDGSGRKGYKSTPCRYYHKGGNCSQGNKKLAPLCAYYHSVAEARCYLCKKDGRSYIGHGSHDHDQDSNTQQESAVQTAVDS